jgi:hypothetical protein
MMTVYRAAAALAGGMLALGAGAADAANTLYPGTVRPAALLAPSYEQNFDTLARTGGTSSALPAGWQVFEGGSNGNGSYAVGDGSINTGNVYSFGTGSNSDRALGSLTSGALTPTYIGAVFSNGLSDVISSLTLSYTGEQWRAGSANETLAFEYSLNATGVNNGTWESITDLDFVAPITGGSDRALNGNLAANRTSLTYTFADLALAQGATFAIRWMDRDAGGTDDGLAIDDFSLVASTVAAVPEPASWGMMLVGFGFAGAALRRRRAASGAAFA